jgi:hypothetical protein
MAAVGVVAVTAVDRPVVVVDFGVVVGGAPPVDLLEGTVATAKNGAATATATATATRTAVGVVGIAMTTAAMAGRRVPRIGYRPNSFQGDRTRRWTALGSGHSSSHS